MLPRKRKMVLVGFVIGLIVGAGIGIVIATWLVVTVDERAGER